MSRLVPSQLMPALLLLLVLATTACGTALGSPNVAATVNGADIPMSVVEDAYDELQGTAFYDGQLQTLGPVEVERVGTSGILSALIQEQLLIGAAADRGIAVPTQDEIDARLAEFAEGSGQDVDTFLQNLAANEGVVSAQVQAVLTATLLEEAITADIVEGVEVTEDDLQAAYEAQYLAQPLVVALVGSDPGAIVEVSEDLRAAGSDLASLQVFAESLFADQGGPQLQQAPPPEQIGGAYAEAYAALEPGVVTDPVDAGDGLWVALYEVAPPPLDEVREELEVQAQEQAAQSARQAAIDEVRFNADIVVNPRFGQYDPLSQQVTWTDPLGALESAVPDAAGTDAEGLPPFEDAPPVGEDLPPAEDAPAADGTDEGADQ